MGAFKRSALLLLGASALAAGVQAATISQGLERQLSGLQAQDELKVLLWLEDQANIASLDLQLHRQCVPLADRHSTVLRELQDVAAISQPAVIRQLESLKNQGKVLGFTPHWLINSVVVRAEAGMIQELASLDGVEWLEADLVPELITPLPGDENEHGSSRDNIGVTDGLRAIHADQVWYELGITGAGALVANLDTGVNGNHVALTSRWRGNTAPAAECWLDVLGTSSSPSDSHGHGSHVMGTITGLAPNDSIGVAPGAEWIACNAINQGAGSEFDNDILAAFEWFADPDGDELTMDDVPDVIQNSWGVNESFSGYVDCDSRWWNAIDNCEAAGVVVTWSAGNEGPGSGTHRSPADRADTPTSSFSVGSTIQTSPYTISSFSSRGPSTCVAAAFPTKPEVVAPGSNIYSVDATGTYTTMSGTSMAGPHVAGVAGLMRSANPDLDVITIKEILMSTATDLGSVGEDNTYGFGLINAYDAVVAAMTGFSTVGGSVTDAVTLQPLSGVSVQVLNGAMTSTDGSGLYEFNLAAGDYTLDFTSFGYQSHTEMITVIQDLPYMLDVSLNAVPSATLSGVVYDSSNMPLAGAQVRIVGSPLAPQLTGAGGNYSFQLPIGESFTVVCQGNTTDEALPLGPDLYGYRAFDPSDANWSEIDVTMVAQGLVRDLRGVNRVTDFSHILIDPDQGGLGSALAFSSDDETIAVSLPFNFNYYGQSYSTISVCGNGWVALGTTASTDFSGYEIPDPADGPLAMLAPFWEDLSPQRVESGNVSTWYDVVGGAFVIEYNGINQYTPTDAFETFAVHLLDPVIHETVTGDGAIVFWYGQIANSDNTSIGIESPDGSDGLQYWFGKDNGVNQPGGTLSANCDPLSDGLMILYTTGMLTGTGPVLTPVTDLMISTTPTMVQLNWSAQPAAGEYRVEMALEPGAAWQSVATVTEPSWSSMLVNGTHLYRVIAIDVN